jgi:uncharacterized protein DUF6011
MKPAHCKICRRKLENAESVAKGIGPECAQKFAFMLCEAGLTLEQLGISEEIATNPNVARHLHSAKQAMLAGNRTHVERFKLAALEAVSWEEERRLYYGSPIQAAEGATA